MFIYNFKINGGRTLRIIIVILSVFMLSVFLISIYRIFFASGTFKVKDEIESNDIIEIEANNYTNILQAVHDNPDSYIGMKIKFTGYMYRLFDFDEEQFVIARDMFINNEETQTVVVGFLCQYKDADNFEDGTWVNITGIIQKGKYHNDEIPIINVTNLEETSKPSEDFVNPPSNTYIPTSGIF
jgi:putative membrane protein